MQQSDAKRRRLAALNQRASKLAASPAAAATSEAAAAANQQRGASQPRGASQQPRQRPLRQQQAPAPTPSAAPPTDQDQERPGAFPYTPLASLRTTTSAVAGQLLLPPLAACKGNVDDVLAALMAPNMPAITAHNMITTRVAEKSILLDNPLAKLNIARASSASKGRRQLLAGKLLPRAKRCELSELPRSGLDYAALLQLHELWLQYVSSVLGGKPEPERLWQQLDWHGALLRVTACKDAAHVGRAGIVAKARANSLLLVGPDGRAAAVPIKGATFECCLPPHDTPVVLAGPSMAKLQCRSAAAAGAAAATGGAAG